MDAIFAILAALTVVSAAGAMFLRNLVHCALCLAVTFGGLAMLYLKLGAQFVGFAQVLVYVGAVAILILFAILLTRSGQDDGTSLLSSKWWLGAVVAGAVFGTLAFCVQGSFVSGNHVPSNADPSVKAIGTALMNNYVLPLEVIGLLLTAALIGAVIIAQKEKETK
jgi:NADH-quinone oxidoreductase subunit J